MTSRQLPNFSPDGEPFPKDFSNMSTNAKHIARRGAAQ